MTGSSVQPPGEGSPAAEIAFVGDGRPRAVPAGLARRFGSASYELLLMTALLFVANFLLLPLVTPGAAGSAGGLMLPSLPARVFLFCGLFAILAAYFTWCWSGGRRTLPMKTWHLRLVDGRGAAPSRRGALLRYLAAWIGPGLATLAYFALKPAGFGATAWLFVGFNYLWAWIDPERAFLHDRIAGTRLVVGE